MKKVLNILAYGLVGLLLLSIAGVILLGKELPRGERDPEAEALADSILASVNAPAWESLRFVSWDFPGGRTCVWDQWYNIAEIRWRDNRVLLNLNTLEGRAWDGGLALEGKAKREMLQKAWKIWCNDSFWVNPFVKIRDTGTERRSVDLEDGSRGLLVTFTSGGVTPGDSYLWVMGEDGLPAYCRMWVSVLPVKGIRVTWENWVDVGGARVALDHRIGPFKLRIPRVQSGDHHSDLGLDADPFGDFN